MRCIVAGSSRRRADPIASVRTFACFFPPLPASLLPGGGGGPFPLPLPGGGGGGGPFPLPLPGGGGGGGGGGGPPAVAALAR